MKYSAILDKKARQQKAALKFKIQT